MLANGGRTFLRQLREVTGRSVEPTGCVQIRVYKRAPIRSFVLIIWVPPPGGHGVSRIAGPYENPIRTR
jgi:hypothetical protein